MSDDRDARDASLPVIPTSMERERYVQRALSARLFAEQIVGELSHLPLGAIAVALLWASLPHGALASWYSVLAIVSLIRMATRLRVRGEMSGSGVIPLSLRISIVAVAVVWGMGIVLAAPAVPQVEVALLLLMICGLTAAATSTLLADPPTYVAYSAAILGLSAIGVLPLLSSRPFVVALAVIVLYGLVMGALYRRLRFTLVQSLITQFELEQSRASVDHDRAFLDQLVVNAPNPIVILDAEYRVRRVNSAFERTFGYAAPDTIGRKLSDLIVPEDERSAAMVTQNEVQSGITVQNEARRRRSDGSIIHVRVAAAHIGRSDSTFVMYDDISDRTRIEQTLRESEDRLFKTLANLPVGIMVIDVDGKPLFANESAKALLGAGIVPSGSDGNRGLRYAAFLAGTNQHYPPERSPIIRALRGEDTAVDDMEIHRPDGSMINIEVSGSPVRDGNGDVIFGVAAFTDITERRRVADALSAARVAAEEATAAKSAFLANMSHEIRTPLNGILGLAELLADDEMPVEQRRSVQLIISSGETLLHVINDILDFSKIEAGQLDIESTTIDLAAIVESTARLLMPKAVEKSIEIVSEVDENVPPGVLGDPTRIRQVLTNLVGNAVKFTPRGEVVVTVSLVSPVAESAERARVRFTVRDTGTGIPADKLDTIFDPFRQADATTTRRYGGTGLGLSISRRLIELLGGSLTVESTMGVGSAFQFVLDLPVVEAAQTAANATRTVAGTRVLVVDDNATNRRVMRGTLERAGCTVAEAADGHEALETLRDAEGRGAPMQLLITDLLMPELDGFQLVAAMRADPALAETPAVMVTSIARRGDGQRCRELGIGVSLLKPVSRGELLDAVRGTVGQTIRTQVEPIGARVVTPNLPNSPNLPQVSDMPPVRRLDILLAEDNAVNQEVAAAMLRRRGHRVTIVDTGRDAVEQTIAHRFDLVLMDLQMPEMDGIEATEEIRRRLGAEGPRIIALTANALTGERERCLAAGMNGYLSKPYRSTELLAIVERRGSTPAIGTPIVPPSSDAVDLRSLRRDLELGGVGEIFDDIIAVFVRDVPSRMATLRDAVSSGDARGIERAAHAFKSAAATIHARRLADLLQELERNGRALDLGDAPVRLAEIERACDATQRQLDSLKGDRRHG